MGIVLTNFSVMNAFVSQAGLEICAMRTSMTVREAQLIQAIHQIPAKKEDNVSMMSVIMSANACPDSLVKTVNTKLISAKVIHVKTEVRAIVSD